jgi:Cu/Ag efflux protein CusF
MRTKKAFLVVLGLALAVSTAAFAQEERPHEGQITKIDADAKMITVKDELGDQWDLFWSDATHADENGGLLELKPGDFVQFSYEDREGRKVLTDIRHRSKAKWLKLVGDVSRLV